MFRALRSGTRQSMSTWWLTGSATEDSTSKSSTSLTAASTCGPSSVVSSLLEGRDDNSGLVVDSGSGCSEKSGSRSALDNCCTTPSDTGHLVRSLAPRKVKLDLRHEDYEPIKRPLGQALHKNLHGSAGVLPEIVTPNRLIKSLQASSLPSADETPAVPVTALCC